VAELLQIVEEIPELITCGARGAAFRTGREVSYWALGEMAKAQAGVLESDAADEAALGGIVEHVGGETEQRFRGDDGLLEVVHRGLKSSACGPDTDGETQGKERRR
jgi:hypothetical protein